MSRLGAEGIGAPRQRLKRPGVGSCINQLRPIAQPECLSDKKFARDSSRDPADKSINEAKANRVDPVVANLGHLQATFLGRQSRNTSKCGC